LIDLRGSNLCGDATEIPQDLELQFLGHASQFARAGRIEDDLERGHGRFDCRERNALDYIDGRTSYKKKTGKTVGRNTAKIRPP